MIFDDMISTGGSVVGAAQVARANGAREIFACATHAVLCGPAVERLRDAPLRQIVVTETGATVELRATYGAADARPLESVDVRVRKADWRPEDLRLTFRDMIYEVTELDSATLPTDELPPDLRAELGVPTPPRIETKAAILHDLAPAPATIPALPVNLPDLEMDVAFQLHEIDADLSEPIEVRVEGGQILIAASGASAAAQQRLHRKRQPEVV